MRNSKLKHITVNDPKFNCSDLRGSDFSDSYIKNSSFKSCDLQDAICDGADLSAAKLTTSYLRKSNFQGSILNNADFTSCDLSGACFDNLIFIGTILKHSRLKETSYKNAVFHNVYFKWAEVKKTIFDGAAMDKLTYATLKNSKADLSNVTLI